ISEEAVLRSGPQTAAIKDAVFDVAAAADGHVKTARRHLRESKLFSSAEERKRVWGLLAQGLPAALYLERLEKVGFDVWALAGRREWRLPWRAWWGGFRGEL